MTEEEHPSPAAAPDTSPAVPDYLASPNAVFADEGVQWRYGKPPDYSKTRKFWEESRKADHATGSLPQLVENLVKNWEVEASFKPRLEDWRTIDHDAYTFAMNGGPPQTGDHMLKVGTYNAIIEPNEYYDPNYSDFASSHKTFKRMMPTFAWEVIEVYSGPPVVSFKWRHWGQMKNDYVGFNNKGEKVTAKAHGGPIEIYGVTIAKVDDKIRVQSLDTWMDPLAMFRQIAPHGVVNKEIMNHKVAKVDALDQATDHNGVAIAQEHNAREDAHQSSSSRGETIAEPNIQVNEQPQSGATSHIKHTGGCPFIGSGSDNTHVPMPDDHPGIQHVNLAHEGASATNGTAVENGTTNGHDGDKPVSDAVHRASSEGEESAGTTVRNEATTVIAPPTTAMEVDHTANKRAAEDDIPRSIYSSAVSGNVEDVIKTARQGDYEDESKQTGTYDTIDEHPERSADVVHPHPKDTEQMVHPEPGEAVAVAADSGETRATMNEMSEIKPGEDELTMNRE